MRWRRSLSMLRARLDGGCDGQAGPQSAERGIGRIQHDAHRHALDDFGEIAGGVLGRNDTEDRAGARREAGDMAAEWAARKYIGDHTGILARVDPRELVLFEICIHPEAVRWNDADEIGADRHIGADADG